MLFPFTDLCIAPSASYFHSSLHSDSFFLKVTDYLLFCLTQIYILSVGDAHHVISLVFACFVKLECSKEETGPLLPRTCTVPAKNVVPHKAPLNYEQALLRINQDVF